MGRIKLDCITVNQNNTLIYGIGNAFLEGVPEKTVKWGNVVIVRSQPNPTSFRNIQWRVIAAIQAEKVPFYWEQAFGTVDCAVSRMGVFTAMAHKTPKGSLEKVEWSGVTFDPARGWAEGWNVFTTEKDYSWQDIATLRTHEAIYMQQPVKAVGALPEATVRDRFIHGLSSYNENILRLGSFGPLDLTTKDTVTSWNQASLFVFSIAHKDLSHGLQPYFYKPVNSAYTRLGPSHAHIYYKDQNMIRSYPLANISAPMPEAVTTMTKEGVTLSHILPGTHEGKPFLVCIGTSPNQSRELYFINNYLNTTTAGPMTVSPSYEITYLPTIRPLQFVNIQYPATDNRPAWAKEIMFGISITLEGELYGINLTGNQTTTDTRPGQSSNSGYVFVDQSYESILGLAPKNPNPDSNSDSHMSPRMVGGILGGLLAGNLVILLLYKMWKKRRNRQLKNANAAAVALPVGTYQPPGYGPGPGQGQDIELMTPPVPYTYNPSSRHDGPDVPPAYRA
ncbi:hypothetical protein BGZ95_003786 [Linnemannia exigua]|uniref:Uncharacterized protein n=1 Tax=Linnemannia exigua TaxID=604196 RepID=A0AAD4D489_9FUNG|nr:hypothetical protein BGZ95_003786 [Linnemannia exigua]